MRHGLEVSDALARHDAVVGKGLGRVEGRTRHAQGIGGHAHAVFAQALQQHGIGAGALAHQAVVGNKRVFNVNERCLRAANPLLLELVDVETLVRQFHHKQADRVRLQIGRSARRHHQKVGNRRIRDVELAAVELPAAIDFLGLGLHGADVGAAVRLAKRKTGNLVARQRRAEEAFLLAFRADLPNGPDRQVRLRRPAGGKRLTHIAELFANDAVAHLVHAGAAIRLGIAHTQ
ncbi:hypothetical protein SDC9_152563 [bioreactor metagenome]|uniref:Uncharacterized protein n=1 Tax=bioreactor metagenome TaxID=1076179 RepID=A0A645EXU7_9ZZZZ